MTMNHNEALVVRTSMKAGVLRKPGSNHNEALAVRSATVAGRIVNNHSEALAVRGALKAGAPPRFR